MKTTLELPDELMRRLKVRAASTDRKLKDTVEEVMMRGLEATEADAGAVVVISEEEYLQLTGNRKSFREYLMTPGPDLEGLDLDRDQSSGRDVSL